MIGCDLDWRFWIEFSKLYLKSLLRFYSILCLSLRKFWWFHAYDPGIMRFTIRDSMLSPWPQQGQQRKQRIQECEGLVGQWGVPPCYCCWDFTWSSFPSAKVGEGRSPDSNQSCREIGTLSVTADIAERNCLEWFKSRLERLSPVQFQKGFYNRGLFACKGMGVW